MNTALYETYVQILHEELVPAMGCTEPIAVAYAGALARQTLGTLPERIELTVSGNIITAKGMGVALEFALELTKALYGKEKADEIASSVMAK